MVIIWDAATGAQRTKGVGHRGVVTRVTFADGGKTLVSMATRIDGAKAVREWKTWDAATGIALDGGDELREGGGPLHGDLALSPDGQFVVRANDTTVCVYAVSDNELLLTLAGHKHRPTTAAFSPDGRLLATADGALDMAMAHPVPWKNGDIRVWDPQTGKLLARFHRHSGPVMNVAFSHDGQKLASASYDGTVKLWDVAGLGAN